jgi:uncharacterized protein (DUF111 family)
LLFDSVELEIIADVVCKGTWWFKITYNLKECRVLAFVVEVFYHADELNSDTQMIDSLILIQLYADLPFNIFSILLIEKKCMTGIKIDDSTYHEYGSFEGVAGFVLDGAVLAGFYLVDFHINLAWCGKAKERALLN